MEANETEPHMSMDSMVCIHPSIQIFMLMQHQHHFRCWSRIWAYMLERAVNNRKMLVMFGLKKKTRNDENFTARCVTSSICDINHVVPPHWVSLVIDRYLLRLIRFGTYAKWYSFNGAKRNNKHKKWPQQSVCVRRVCVCGMSYVVSFNNMM